MKTRIVFVGALFVLTASCATVHTASPPPADGGVKAQSLVPYRTIKGRNPPDRFGAGYCKARDCDFEVIVKPGATPDKCVLDLDPQWMAVGRGISPYLTFNFEKGTAKDFTFAKSPIFTKPDSVPPEIVKDFSVLRSSERAIVLEDKHTMGGTYRYGIIVLKNGKECGRLDPPIINEY